MPATSSCNPCCAEPLNTNVPGIQGDPGIDGTNGTNGTDGTNGTNGVNGVNAFTLTDADFDVPALVTQQVSVTVLDTSWMFPDLILFIQGPGTFRVVSVTDATTVLLEWLDYPGDVAGTTTIASGAGVAILGSAPLIYSLSVYASGTAYSLTATPALLAFGTTTPSLVISQVGTWLIMARVRYDYNAATFAASRTVTTNVKRTNNTASVAPLEISGSWKTDIITTLSYTAVIHTLPPLIYTTANDDDILQLYGSIDVVPTAGSLDAVEAEIVAIKLQS